MSREKQHHIQALRRLSFWGQWVSVLSAGLIIGYAVYLAFDPAEAIYLMQTTVPGANVSTLPSKSVLLFTAAVAAVPLILFLFCLYSVWKLFSLTRKGDVFSAESTATLTTLGRYAMGCAVASLVTRALVSMLVTSANPAGQKMLAISISSADIAGVLIGMLVFLFAGIAREATALAQENQSFI
jgi:hypothetical protein